jgi:hypothetical protein
MSDLGHDQVEQLQRTNDQISPNTKIYQKVAVKDGNEFLDIFNRYFLRIQNFCDLIRKWW